MFTRSWRYTKWTILNEEHIYIYSKLLIPHRISLMMCFMCLQCGWMFLNNWRLHDMDRIDISFNECMSTSCSKKVNKLKITFYPKPGFWPSGKYCRCLRLSGCMSLCQIRACPHHNSPIQARTTSFGPEVQNTLAMIDLFVIIHLSLYCQPPSKKNANVLSMVI